MAVQNTTEGCDWTVMKFSMIYSTGLNSNYNIKMHFHKKNQNKQKFDIEFMFEGNLYLLKLQQSSRILVWGLVSGNRKLGQVMH